MAPAWLPLAAFVALTNLVGAIEFTSPKAGASVAGGTALEIEWKDGSDGPTAAELTTYQLFLCAGGNEPDTITQLYTITTAGTFGAGNKAQGVIPAGTAGDTPENAYFVKMEATAQAGGTYTVFSSRFSMTDMTGTMPAAVTEAMKDVDGTDGPAAIDGTTQAAADPAADEYDVDYTMQTGLTRYAPMQPLPPTKITKKTATPLHPTSAFTIATTHLKPPKQQTTVTQSRSYSFTSVENTVAAASHATDDMARFLNRWRD